MSWRNPILGGDGALVVAALKSSNFVTAQPFGSGNTGQGWSLQKSGVAEFGSNVYASTFTNATSGMNYQPVLTGTQLVSFTSLAQTTVTVFFLPQTFINTPNVHCNINSGAAVTSNWHARAINITNTQFTLFVFGPSANTWSNVGVQWTAVGL